MLRGIDIYFRLESILGAARTIFAQPRTLISASLTFYSHRHVCRVCVVFLVKTSLPTASQARTTQLQCRTVVGARGVPTPSPLDGFE